MCPLQCEAGPQAMTPPEEPRLLQIVSRYFVAGIELQRRAAPIVRYMASWPEQRIRDYCTKKGWKVHVVA